MKIMKWIIYSILISKAVGYLLKSLINNNDYLIIINLTIFISVLLYGYTRQIRQQYNYIPSISISYISISYTFFIALMFLVLTAIALYISTLAITGGTLEVTPKITYENIQLFYTLLLLAILEELLHRGFLLSFMSRYLPTIAAVLASSAIFSISHFDTHGLIGLTTLFFLGILLGLMTVLTKNLLPAIICHTLYNLIFINGSLYENIFIINMHSFTGLLVFDSYTSKNNSYKYVSYAYIFLSLISVFIYSLFKFKKIKYVS